MSTTEVTNSVPPYVFEQKGTFPAPFTFDVPASLEVRPETATAKFDGTHASGNFLACLTFYGSDGERLGRWFNPTVLAPGSKAEVTFTPPFGSAATNVTPGGSGIQFDTDNEGGWLDVKTNNTDPGGLGMKLIDASGGGIDIDSTHGGIGNIEIAPTADTSVIVGNSELTTFSAETAGPAGPGALKFYMGANPDLGGDLGFVVFDTANTYLIIDQTADTVTLAALNEANGFFADATDAFLYAGGFQVKVDTVHGFTLVGLPLAPGASGTLWNNGGVVQVAP